MLLSRSLYAVSESNLFKIVPNAHHRLPRGSPTTYHAPSDIPLVLPPHFMELTQDGCTNEFLANAKLRRSTTKDALGTVLQGMGYSLTDANALVDRGKMFLLGKSHLDKLLGSQYGGKLLLDVGAGDGNITSQVSSSYETTVAVETSAPMGRRLRERGYITSTDPDIIFDKEKIGSHCYDLVLLLNVLDRADKPLSLLRGLKALLKPNTGRLVLAVVLPWCPFVESGKKQKVPSERLPMVGGLCREGATFERSVAILWRDVLQPLGFEIETWSRLPYLSEGDSEQDIYILDDVVFVLKAAGGDEKEVTVAPNMTSIASSVSSTTTSESLWSFLF